MKTYVLKPMSRRQAMTLLGAAGLTCAVAPAALAGPEDVAARIAELTGGEAFDGFNSSKPFDQIAVAVIDCGGTARIGVYPMKKVPTVDIHATSPAGPLAMFITEDLLVTGVKLDNINPA